MKPLDLTLEFAPGLELTPEEVSIIQFAFDVTCRRLQAVSSRFGRLGRTDSNTSRSIRVRPGREVEKFLPAGNCRAHTSHVLFGEEALLNGGFVNQGLFLTNVANTNLGVAAFLGQKKSPVTVFRGRFYSSEIDTLRALGAPSKTEEDIRRLARLAIRGRVGSVALHEALEAVICDLLGPAIGSNDSIWHQECLPTHRLFPHRRRGWANIVGFDWIEEGFPALPMFVDVPDRPLPNVTWLPDPTSEELEALRAAKVNRTLRR
jgi:hypothetical protein